MKLYQELESQLKKEPNFVTDNGELKKWVVLNKAQNFDEELIVLLLGNEELKDKFFKQVAGVTIFDQNLFARFLEQKNYLNDSYTQYKNKVGLTINGKYLKQRNEVALVWPFKDCVLEGGQSREEDKREEIFFNEILAQDEITQLLEPKVLTNAKTFDKDGEHPFENFTRDAELNKERGLPADTITANLIIKGNNLLALHSLKKEFAGKVKLIYIDPPYNTGNDGFNYNDSFTHSAWLTFTKNRLQIAKELLQDGGLIITQIDSSRNNKNGRIGTPELAYLSLLLDEVFGRKNYVGHLHWKKKKQPSFLSKIAGIMESILIYSTNESKVSKLQIGTTSDTTTRVDNADNKNSICELEKGIRYMGEGNHIIKAGVYKNKTMQTEFLEDVIIKNGNTQNNFKVKAKFRTTQSQITKFCKEDLLYITQRNSLRRFKTEKEKKKGKTITDLLLDWGQNQDATNEIKNLFNITDDTKPFETPKPELLLSKLIESTTSENDIVLDYHLGSGTTAAVAHKMNRQYIGIEQMDYIETVAVERLKKVVEGEQGGISKPVNWQGGGSFVYLELKKYNQTFIEQIASTRSVTELLEIWEQMKVKSFLNYNVDIKKQEEHLEDFKQLSLEEQKQHLCELLDKNQLYVNLSSLNDTEFACTDGEKKVTQDFYQTKG